MGVSTLQRCLLAAVALGTIQLAGCHEDDNAMEKERKQAITAVKQSFEHRVPVCSLANKDVSLGGTSLAPDWWPGSWSSMRATPSLGKPKAWDVTFEFWCYGETASHASTRVEGTAHAEVVLGDEARVVSWSETSSSRLSLLTQLIWLLVVVVVGTVVSTAILFGTVGYGLFRLLGFISEFSVSSEFLGDLAKWFLKVLWRLFIPVLLVLLVVASGASGYIAFHSVPGTAIGVFLAWRIAAALLRCVKRLQTGGTWFGEGDGRRSHRRVAVLVFLGLCALGIHATEITTDPGLGLVVGLLVCGTIGLLWGPLVMGGARHSASVGVSCGAVAGALCGAQIVLPEWWILAVLVGAAAGTHIDRSQS